MSTTKIYRNLRLECSIAEDGCMMILNSEIVIKILMDADYKIADKNVLVIIML